MLYADVWVKPVNKDSILPDKAHNGDAGFDVYAQTDIEIPKKSWRKIPLGVVLILDPGFVGLVVEKSGLANRYGLFSIAGVIDSGYRGEIHAIMYNAGDETAKFSRGDKVAQLLIMPCYTGTKYEIVYEIPCKTERGEGGFGSSGDKKK